MLGSANHVKEEGSYRFGGGAPAPISLGRGAWTGAHVVITAGVTIGAGAAVAAGAALALAAVDGEAVLKITELARRLDVIAQGGPPRFDCLVEDALDGRRQPFGPPPGPGSGGPARRYPRPEQSFTDLDVAESRPGVLIQ